MASSLLSDIDPAMKISLTRGLFAVIDSIDHPVISRYKWYAYLGPGGLYYAVTRPWIKSEKRYVTIRMHRYLLGVTDPKIKVDHKNGDSLDNTRENLRIATDAQNQYNSKKQVNNKSGYKGVYKHTQTGKWVARINVNYKGIYLGSFDDVIKAARVYDQAALNYFGEFARINGV